MRDETTELMDHLQEMIDAFVPTIRSESRLTQAQGSAVIHSRQLLASLRGERSAKIIEFPASADEIAAGAGGMK